MTATALISTIVVMITFTLILALPAPKRAELLRAITAHTGPTNVQPGCLRCYLYQDVKEPQRIALIEEWDSQTSLDANLRSQTFRGVLEAIEASNEPPRIQFDTVATRSGIEVIAAALGREV